MDDMKKNGSGYVDPTAFKAYQRMKKDREYLAKNLAYTIYRVAHLAGFNVAHITLVDNATGKVYKK